MTRDEEIRRAAGNVAIRDNKGQYAHGFLMQALREAFTEGAEWADGHPRWISVEDELPEKGEVVFITDGELTDTGFYDYDDAWQPYMQWLGDITHWMPLPQPPSSSEIPNNYKKGGEQ